MLFWSSSVECSGSMRLANNAAGDGGENSPLGTYSPFIPHGKSQQSYMTMALHVIGRFHKHFNRPFVMHFVTL